MTFHKVTQHQLVANNMSNNIYDILNKLPKSILADAVEAEPIYESVDPRGDILEAVNALEAKYEQHKEKSSGEINYLNPQAKRFVQLAKAKFPETSSDLEAVVAAVGDKTQELDQRDKETADWIARAKASIDTQQKEIADTEQAVNDANARYNAQEKRLQDFNRQVAASELDVKQQAQAALDYAKQPGAEPADIISKVKAELPAQPTAEPIAPKEPEQAKAPRIVTPIATPKPATATKPADVKPAPKIDPKDKPFDPTSLAANDDKQDELKFGESKRVNESTEMLKEYKENDPQLGYMIWDQLLKAWKQRLPKVDLNFDGRHVTLWIDQIYGILTDIGSDQNQERKQQRIENILSSYNNTVNILMSPRCKKFIKQYEVFAKQDPAVKKAKAKQKELAAVGQQELPGMQPGVNYKLPAGSREMQENLGNNIMSANVEKLEENLLERFMNFKEDAKPDFLDLDKDGDTDEPMKQAAKDAKKHEPADVDKDAVAKRKRLQALKDKQEDERAEKGDDYKSATRFVKGRAYGGSAQKDDEDKDELDEANWLPGQKGIPVTNPADAITKKPGYVPPPKYVSKPPKYVPSGNPLPNKQVGTKYSPQGTPVPVMAPKKTGELDEKAVSKAQQKFMGMVHAVQKGKMKAPSKDVANTAKGMTKKAAKDFAATKHKGLPQHVAESRVVESDTTFDHICKRFPAECKKFKSENGMADVAEISQELYDALYDYYLHNGEMPYGTAKARTGDPYQWISDRFAQDLGIVAETLTMEEPLLDAVQELDEIARLAGLPTKTCEACSCNPCKCDEGLEAMAPSDSSSPLTHTDLDEAMSRKDYRSMANEISQMENRDDAKRLAHKYAVIAKKDNSRFKEEMFFAACGLEECDWNMGSAPMIVGEEACPTCNEAPCKCDEGMMEAEMEEGNEFSGALAAAKAAGEKEFEVDGKKYTVKEDININVSANGEEDVVNLIRKLSGMPVVAVAQSAVAEEVVAEESPKEREIEHTNTPREEVAGTDAAIPTGLDLNRAKKSYSRKPFHGDNPMAIEENLWTAYETMINDVKA